MPTTKFFRCLAPALLGLTVLAGATITLANEESTPADSEIRDLLVQKRDVLASKVEHAEQSFGLGKLTSAAVFDAKFELLEAELRLTDSPAERIELLERQLKIRRAKENELKRQYLSSDAGKLEHFDAIAARIDAEIALASARRSRN